MYATSAGITNGPMFIKNNDDELCRAYVVSDGSVDTATCSAIAELSVGDSVRVTGDSSDPGVIQADGSGFVGHIIIE